LGEVRAKNRWDQTCGRTRVITPYAADDQQGAHWPVTSGDRGKNDFLILQRRDRENDGARRHSVRDIVTHLSNRRKGRSREKANAVPQEHGGRMPSWGKKVEALFAKGPPEPFLDCRWSLSKTERTQDGCQYSAASPGQIFRSFIIKITTLGAVCGGGTPKKRTWWE